MFYMNKSVVVVSGLVTLLQSASASPIMGEEHYPSSAHRVAKNDHMNMEDSFLNIPDTAGTSLSDSLLGAPKAAPRSLERDLDYKIKKLSQLVDQLDLVAYQTRNALNNLSKTYQDICEREKE